MKKLKIVICVVLAGIAACAAYFVWVAEPKTPEPVNYTIYVYKNGEAEIAVDNINHIIQIDRTLVLGDTTLKAGTIILPGNGSEIYYNYERHDTVP